MQELRAEAERSSKDSKWRRLELLDVLLPILRGDTDSAIFQIATLYEFWGVQQRLSYLDAVAWRQAVVTSDRRPTVFADAEKEVRGRRGSARTTSFGNNTSSGNNNHNQERRSGGGYPKPGAKKT